MRRARKMWTHIAEEQAQLEAIDQKPPDWTAGKKSARSIGAASSARKQGKVRIAELLGPG